MPEQPPSRSKPGSLGRNPELQKLLSGDGWRLTPATMAVRLSRGYWKPARHLLYISAKIAAALKKGGARLIFTLPARHGKSELISIHTPAWVLDRDPMAEVILTSYGSELATDFGRKCRDNILANEDLLRCKLRHDALQVARFLTTEGGGMRAVGIGGPITGRGADLLLVDDYLKNAKDSSSETIRDDIFDWFISTAMTRLEPNGSAIILATRWNIDDLIGRLTSQTNDVWEVITFPAIAETNDVIGRKPGEALWPERFNEDALAAIKRSLTTYFWEALYQQKPIPKTAGLMQGNWLNPVDILPHYSRLQAVRYWDLASTMDGGDYTVGAKLEEDTETGITYISDIKRKQLSPAEVEVLVKSTAIEDGPDCRIEMEQEPGSAGKTVIDTYARKILKGFMFTGKHSSGDKFIRAQPFLAAAEAGIIRMKHSSWNKDLIEEFELFPDGPYDDQVDAVTGAYNFLNRKRYKGVVWGRGDRGESSKPEYTVRGEDDSQLVTGVVWGRR